MGKIEVGGRYTSVNGNKWECIFIRDGVAWLAGVNRDGAVGGAAYRFNLDGTHICLNSSYDIKFEPGVEWVDTKGSWAKKGDPQHNHYQYRLRFPLIDGTPDWSQAKVTPA